MTGVSSRILKRRIYPLFVSRSLLSVLQLTRVRILAARITPALARNIGYTRVFSENIQTFTTLEQALRAMIAHTLES